jgi:hypothetical protein
MSALGSLSSDDQNKFDSFAEKAKHYFQEMEDIRGSLKDLSKALADELGVKPKLVMMAARTAYKDDLLAKQEDMEAMTELLRNTSG